MSARIGREMWEPMALARFSVCKNPIKQIRGSEQVVRNALAGCKRTRPVPRNFLSSEDAWF